MEDQVAVADSIQESSIDIDQASNDLAGDLFPASAGSHDETVDDVESEVDAAIDEVAEPELDGAATDEAATEVTDEPESASPPPSTWPKEMHAHWAKTPKEVQEYWAVREKQMLDGLEQYKENANYGRQLKEVIGPYMPIIQAQGVEPQQAVQYLLNAHYKLSTGSPSQRTEYFTQLAKQYNVELGQQFADGQPQDTRYTQLQDEIHNLKQIIQSGSQQAYNAERDRVSKEVSAFAADHPYFDDVADDLIIHLRAGLSIQDAYDRAVWANPVTRAKEQARLQTEAKAESEKKAREQAEAAKKAASANVRSRDTRRTPTEAPRGTMKDLEGAMKEAMREIRSRQTH